MSPDEPKPPRPPAERRPTDDVGGPAAADEQEDPLFEAEPPEDLVPAPANVMELCAACVRYVASRYKTPLDFTSDTLSLLDAYVRDSRVGLKERPESLRLLETTVGAYLGEVIRRAFGGAWFAVGDADGWRVDLSRVYLTFNPIGMAREALLLDAQEGWHAHLEMDPGEREIVEARLASLDAHTGGVHEDEYYAPTTRYDVVALAVDALRAHMIEQGVGDVRFTAEDYRKR
jgi:hypothetical protein